jgi:ATP-binding cassette subfamily G (WHITE) protein 2
VDVSVFVWNNLVYIINAIQGTIIFSIHQPRYSIFKLFDSVLLMCKGKSVYHGSALSILPYFNAQGYQCELHDNPADFALDVLIDVSRKPENLEKLNRAYVESQMHTSINSLTKSQPHDEKLEILRRKQQGAAGRSLGTEIYYVSERTLKNAIRNPSLFLSQIVVAIILGLLVGLVFYDMKKTTDPGVQNRLGAIFFIVVSQIFSTVTALEPLLKERVLFIHVSFCFH